jgi:glycine dehydrogenase
MVGMQVVVTKPATTTATSTWPTCKAKCEKHSANLACVMITYPSTHGVFETR